MKRWAEMTDDERRMEVACFVWNAVHSKPTLPPRRMPRHWLETAENFIDHLRELGALHD